MNRFYTWTMLIIIGAVLTTSSFAQSLNEVRKLRNSGKYDEAITALKQSSDRNSGDGRLLLARLYLDTKRYREASQILENLCPRHNSENCWNALGSVRMATGYYPQAIDDFKQAIGRNQKSARAHSNLALAYFYARQRDEARLYHEKAIALDPINSQALTNYAIYLIHYKSYNDARDLLQKVLKQNPEFFMANLFMGYAYYQEKQYRQALNYYDAGIKTKPDNFDLYYYRANARYKSGDTGGALSDLKKAEKIFPLNGKTDVLRKLIHKRSGRYGR